MVLASAVVLTWGAAGPGRAEPLEAEPPSGAGRQPAAASRPEEAPSRPSHTLRAAGLRAYVAGRWGVVAAEVVNPADQPADVLATMYFADRPEEQFGRRLWVPPRARRTAWFPALTPDDAASDGGRLEFKSLFYALSGDARTPASGSEPFGSSGQETLIRERSGRMLHDGLLSVIQEPLVTGFIEDPDRAEDAMELMVREAVAALRLAGNRSRRVQGMYDGHLPPMPEGWDALDHLVLANDRLAGDTAALSAVRRWLHAGGRLWILLDRVAPETAARLLGEDFGCQVVDRVGLTEFRIAPAGGEPLALQEHETPVDLVRVQTAGMDVAFTVNGWPAAFWRPVGRGEVLFTTLGAPGWMRLRTADEIRRSDPLFDSRYVATEAFAQLAGRFVRPRAPAPLASEAFEPYLAEQVGYQIVGRRPVVGILGVFCAGLLASGVWLARRDRLDRLAWIAPGSAGVAAAILIALGAEARQSVPPTVAVGQIAEAVPGSHDMTITGQMALYHPEGFRGSLGGRDGGVFQPDASQLDGLTRRMVWTDLDAWHWDNLPLPPGLRTAPFRHSARIDSPVEAWARFGPEGLTGEVAPGPFGEFRDAVIATRGRARLAARLGRENSFAAGPQAVLAPGQFIAEGLLSDEQRRRQAVYQRWLESESAPVAFPAPLTLLAWAAPVDMGFVFPPEVRLAGGAVVVVPLTIEPTPPDTPVTIPAACIPYRSVFGPGGEPPGSPYDHRKDEWTEWPRPARSWLRFQLPAEVLPLRMEHARLTVRISGPAQRLELEGVVDGTSVPLERREDPVGLVRFEIDRPDVLQPDDEGRLVLGLHVGDFEAPRAAVDSSEALFEAWKIHSVSLEASGRTLGASADE